jgi:hypothetical protein
MSEAKDLWSVQYELELGKVADTFARNLSSELWEKVIIPARVAIGESINQLPQRVHPKTLQMLREMTDNVLEARGIRPQAAMTFTFRPRQGSLQPTDVDPGLMIFSIADEVAGYNTTGCKEGEDNSRRWAVYIDRGTIRGAAFDGRGAAYAHGLFDPSTRGTITCNEFDDLIARYHGDDPELVSVDFCQTMEVAA